MVIQNLSTDNEHFGITFFLIAIARFSFLKGNNVPRWTYSETHWYMNQASRPKILALVLVRWPYK